MIWLLLALLLLAAPAWATERFVAPSPTGVDSGSTCTEASPCSPRIAISLSSGDDFVTMQNGTYQGASYMLDFATPNKSGTSGHPITVRAQNDGQVFIDGQNARSAVATSGQSYLTFQGFDFGNGPVSTRGVVDINGGGETSTQITFQRVVGSNANLSASNSHVWGIVNCTSCLFEDVGGFGTGRNIFVHTGSDASTTYRRVWARWDGWNDTGGPYMPMQVAYGGPQQQTLFENIIAIWGDTQDNTGTSNIRAGTIFPRDPAPDPANGNRYRGIIGYGYTSPTTSPSVWVDFNDTTSHITIVDFFIDGRSKDVSGEGGVVITGTNAAATADRMTSIRAVANTPSSPGFTMTNFNECTTLAACPSFYTGDGPATGARNCFEYSNGTLTTTALWPWRMDDRIKNAISRAGGTALSGSAGTGYGANTVTSEIVSRYGSLPAACTRTAPPPPPFPAAPDFPSIGTLDTFDGTGALVGWTTVTGNGWSRVSGVATPTSGFSVVRWNTSFPANQEAWGIIDTLPAADGSGANINFLITDANNRYAVYAAQITGTANDTLGAFKLVSGVSSNLFVAINLNLDIQVGDRVGVRVRNGVITFYYYSITWGEWRLINTISDDLTIPGSGYIGMGADAATYTTFGGGSEEVGPFRKVFKVRKAR